MTYVPIVTPPTSPPPLSPRTRELSNLLTKVLDEYQKAHPKTTSTEMRQALRIAASAAGSDRTVVATSIALVLGLLLAAGGLFAFLFMGSSGEQSFREAVPMIAIGIMVFMIMLIVIIKRNAG